MANWKHHVVVKDIFWKYDGGSGLDEFAQVYADRVHLAVGEDMDGKLAVILTDLRAVSTEKEVDAALDRLYDWADRGHRLWIESM